MENKSLQLLRIQTENMENKSLQLQRIQTENMENKSLQLQRIQTETEDIKGTVLPSPRAPPWLWRQLCAVEAFDQNCRKL